MNKKESYDLGNDPAVSFDTNGDISIELRGHIYRASRNNSELAIDPGAVERTLERLTYFQAADTLSMEGEILPGESILPYSQRRRIPRYTFVAMTALTHETTNACLAGRISEISWAGCYVDVLNTLPVGTLLEMRIFRDAETFRTTGRIIYVREQMGMGVAFVNSSPDQRKILDSWLTDLLLASASIQ
jgi:hypothetical protein